MRLNGRSCRWRSLPLFDKRSTCWCQVFGVLTSCRCVQGSVSQRPSGLSSRRTPSPSVAQLFFFMTRIRLHTSSVCWHAPQLVLLSARLLVAHVSLCFPNKELKEQHVDVDNSQWAWVRVPGPLPHNRWLLLGRNLLLLASSVFSSSTGPPCYPVQFVLCWRPFYEADGTRL